MTKEEWDLKQNSLKNNYRYISTGKPGEVKMIENNEKLENIPSKLSPSGYNPSGRKIHPTLEDQKANIIRIK